MNASPRSTLGIKWSIHGRMTTVPLTLTTSKATVPELKAVLAEEEKRKRQVSGDHAEFSPSALVLLGFDVEELQ